MFWWTKGGLLIGLECDFVLGFRAELTKKTIPIYMQTCKQILCCWSKIALGTQFVLLLPINLGSYFGKIFVAGKN